MFNTFVGKEQIPRAYLVYPYLSILHIKIDTIPPWE